MKNTISLENYGVAAMTTREMRTTNGGGILAGIIIGVVVVAAAEIISDWSNFKAGLRGGLCKK